MAAETEIGRLGHLGRISEERMEKICENKEMGWESIFTVFL